jgi:hypothetical protein
LGDDALVSRGGAELSGAVLNVHQVTKISSNLFTFSSRVEKRQDERRKYCGFGDLGCLLRDVAML